jgi:hypothetical protein
MRPGPASTSLHDPPAELQKQLERTETSPLADQYGSGSYPDLRDPNRSGASRFIADSVKDPGESPGRPQAIRTTVHNGSNQKRPAHAVGRIDTAQPDHLFLNSLVSKVRRFETSCSRLTEPPPTAEDLMSRFATLRVSTANSNYFAALAFRLVPAVRWPVFLTLRRFLKQARQARRVAS